MNQANLDTARLRERRRLMLRIRAFEEAAIRAADNKLVLGCHPPIRRPRGRRGRRLCAASEG